ncbi:MAG: DUF4435 domain-containing protein [Syntrophaceae bacterium]
MISYSKKAFRAIVHLFRPYNDIDIYIEDTSIRNMYEVLINRILNGKARVNRIFPLGGREAVIDACEKDQTDSKRRRLYIIDGDLDLLVGYEEPNLRYCYRLGVCNSENLIICKESVEEIAYEFLPDKNRTQISKIIRFSNFFNKTIKELTGLIIIYGAYYSLMSANSESKIKTTGYNVTQLCESKSRSMLLSKKKIKERIAFIETELNKNFKKTVVKTKIREIKERIPNEEEKIAKLIPGKTYLLPLIYHHLHNKIKYTGNLKELRVRLSRYCRIDKDQNFVEAIQNVSNM